MIRVLGLLCFAAAAVGWAAPATAQPDVTLTGSRQELRVGETVRIEVRVQTRGGSIEDLRLDDLQKYPELEVISHQTVRPMQISFGFGSGMQVESSLAHVYVLRASAPGEYALSPAVARVDGKTYQSQPLTIRVVSGASPGTVPDASVSEIAEVGDLSGARYDDRAFLRTVVEPQDVFVGQQVNVTVYLYTRLRLGPQSLVPSKPAMDGFWVYDDPITQLQGETVLVGGRRYQVYPLYRSVAFPQRVGTLTVGAPSVSFDVGALSFFDAPERVEREGVPVKVEVKPLPPPVPQNAAVGRYELRASLDRSTVQTGDAVTLRVTASGVGNIQDLRIDLPPLVGARALQPAIRDDQRLVSGELMGTRSWEWILIAEAPGQHRVPALEITYFDPKSGQYGTARTPSLSFTASGATRSSQTTIEPVEAPAASETPEFGPIGRYSALRRGETPIRSRAWFDWALAIPPIAFALLALVVAIWRRREQESTSSGAVQRKLLRSARNALEAREPRAFYDRIVAAITHALDTRLREPVTGLPHIALRARLSRAGFDDDLVDRVINELEGADFARFAASGVDEDEMRRCLERTAAIIERVERTKGAT